MTNWTLKQAELLLITCDALRIQPNLELEEIRLFLKEYRGEPKGKEAELTRVRARVFELFKELAAVAKEARGWTQERIEAWSVEAEAGMIAELKRRAAEIDAPREYGVSWARVIAKRRGETQGGQGKGGL